MTKQNESKKWEDVLPQVTRRTKDFNERLNNENYQMKCIGKLKQAEQSGLVCINPPSKDELLFICNNQPLDYPVVSGRKQPIQIPKWQVSGSEELVQAILKRIFDGR